MLKINRWKKIRETAKIYPGDFLSLKYNLIAFKEYNNLLNLGGFFLRIDLRSKG
jgi:hypothetical protein